MQKSSVARRCPGILVLLLTLTFAPWLSGCLQTDEQADDPGGQADGQVSEQVGEQAAGQAQDQPLLIVQDGYVRLPPPGMSMTAGFGQLQNLTGDTQVVTAASSPSFRSVSLHRSVLVDGVAKMRPVKQLTIKPEDSFTLQPGGYHLMLMGAVEPLAEGQLVAVELTLKNAERQILTLPVQRDQ